MLHCCLHLTWLALPGAETKEGHLRAVVQCEGGLHPGAELRAGVAPAADYRAAAKCTQGSTTAITLGHTEQMIGRPKVTRGR